MQITSIKKRDGRTVAFDIGKIAEENPDLSYEDITNILLAQLEADNGNVTEYKFG